MDTTSITQFIEKRKISIILFWIALTVISMAFFAPSFFEKTKNDFAPPNGSDAARGLDLQTQYFPELEEQESHIITVYSQAGQVLGDQSDLRLLTSSVSIWLDTNYDGQWVSMVGYYVFEGGPLDNLKVEFVSLDLTASIIVISMDLGLNEQEAFGHELREFIDDLDLTQVDVYVVGGPELRSDTNEAIEGDLAKIDSITIPLVFILLIFLLKNWRYFPITIAPIFMSILITFGVLERLIEVGNITILSFVPSVLISISLGIGVDYNLFLLTRFREERKKGHDLFDSS
ncbi:MAG: MMPL family transporter, partial [Candidatus Heimdallarchaeota archaeon]|nr:MMPL family transporter [Candidatus Heimdallarchaeota archaeon]